MNRQKKFVEMMEALIGKSINLGDPIGQNKVELEASCAKLKDELGTEFVVNPNEGNEPCPFYCSSIDKPFDFVFIGMNPGKVLDAQNELHLFSWENTTWQELADFCVPTDIREKMNGYQLVKKNSVESEFWKFFLRLHIALTTNEIFNKWEELEKNNKDVEKSFIDHISAHSILNADLIPYKFRKTKRFNVTKILGDTNYRKYFQKLVNFIETESAPDAWIVFYATPDTVKKLLKNFAPAWTVPKNSHLKLRADETKKYSHFYLFAKGQRKILLSPFLLTPKSTSSIYNNINILVDAMKNFERKLSLR